jgi:uncharacterized membrane protein
MPTLTSSARFSMIEAALSFLGAGIAGTLWWAHRQHVDLPCTADGGCSQVAGSRQAYVTLGPWHDVSVALLGFLAYLALLTLSMLKLGSDSPGAIGLWRRLLWVLSAFGFAYSWRLQYVAHFQIGAFCVWCFSSALVMSALFIVATLEAIWSRRHVSVNPSGAAQELPPTHG